MRQTVLSLGQAIPATAPDAMQRMATALQGQGHAVSVMDSNGPSDHKVWLDGEAWTFRSSDPVRCPTITWSPYLQASYDGQGYLACGIPSSAHLGCPPWFAVALPPPPPAPQPVPVPAPVPAPVPPPLNLDLGPIMAKLNQVLVLEQDTNQQITAMNRTLTQTVAAVMAFVGKYIAPAISAYLVAKKVG